jgi:hypothetical protein
VIILQVVYSTVEMRTLKVMVLILLTPCPLCGTATKGVIDLHNSNLSISESQFFSNKGDRISGIHMNSTPGTRSLHMLKKVMFLNSNDGVSSGTYFTCIIKDTFYFSFSLVILNNGLCKYRQGGTVSTMGVDVSIVRTLFYGNTGMPLTVRSVKLAIKSSNSPQVEFVSLDTNLL